MTRLERLSRTLVSFTFVVAKSKGVSKVAMNENIAEISSMKLYLGWKATFSQSTDAPPGQRNDF
jgi:hypothetical protein